MAASILFFVVAVAMAAALLPTTTATVSAFVHPTTTIRHGSATAATTKTQLLAIDPTKEVGVLAPVGFFEYVRVCAYLWKSLWISVVLVHAI
jgi:hypothetical protein